MQRTSKLSMGSKRKFLEIDGKDYPAEELAWFYVTKEWPKGKVLFKDGNPLNLQWENLIEDSACH